MVVDSFTKTLLVHQFSLLVSRWFASFFLCAPEQHRQQGGLERIGRQSEPESEKKIGTCAFGVRRTTFPRWSKTHDMRSREVGGILLGKSEEAFARSGKS